VTKVLQTSRIRRIVALGLVVGALAAVAPATGLASNPGGGGHGPVKTTR
jgi:hypothetical protein